MTIEEIELKIQHAQKNKIAWSNYLDNLLRHKATLHTAPQTKPRGRNGGRKRISSETLERARELATKHRLSKVADLCNVSEQTLRNYGIISAVNG